MKIQLTSKFNSIYNNQVKYNTENYQNNSFPNYISGIKKADTNSIKAFFCPSFGKYQKIKEIELTDKETGNPVKASLLKDRYQDVVCFRLNVNNEAAGFLDMNLYPTYEGEEEKIFHKTAKNIPEVTHLKSIQGDKYRGIGTELIKAAIEESKNIGKEGALWLWANRGYASNISTYNTYKSPIPFYYKLGFESPDKFLNKYINHCIEKSEYTNIPDSALLLLEPEKINLSA